MTITTESLTRALAEITAIVGDEHVLQADSDRRLYSRDIFFWDAAPLCDAVVRPADSAQVAAIARVSAAHGIALAPRGGGVSYTGGYVPTRSATIVLDLSRLNQIREINLPDLYVTVDAACTWQPLDAALKVHGMRPAMKGPISGTHATIGGVASQNTGSASMAPFLSLEVVMADGRIVHTGSAGVIQNGKPFSRCYGPDLTGLFLGDTGTFGIKTRCTLAIEPIPVGVAFASVGFDTMSQITAAMCDIARSGIHCQMLGMDSLKNRTATQVGIRDGARTLAAVVTSADSLLSGIKQAVGIAGAGQSVLHDLPWSLHLTVEGHDQVAADHALDALRPLWARDGRDVAPSVPIAMRSRPYSIRGILGPRGERWIPVHGIFPLSRVTTAVECLQEFFLRHASHLQAQAIEHAYIMTSTGASLLIEPMFYWSDEISPLHARALGDKYRQYADRPANPETRATVVALRRELAELFRRLGAIHSQIGKYYKFAGNLEPDTYAVLQSIKHALDPDGRLNPGNLGFS